MTQANRIRFADYNRAFMTSLWQAYEKPSYEKQKSFHYVKERCHVLNGYGLKIVNKNTFHFTAAFLYEKDGQTWMQYHTYANTYDFAIDE